MAVRSKHVFSQGPVLKVLASTAVSALRQRLSKESVATVLPQLPTAELIKTIPPRPKDLVRDYIRHVGGEPSA